MQCKSCLAENVEGATYCRQCGKRQVKASASLDSDSTEQIDQIARTYDAEIERYNSRLRLTPKQAAFLYGTFFGTAIVIQFIEKEWFAWLLIILWLLGFVAFSAIKFPQYLSDRRKRQEAEAAKANWLKSLNR